MKKIFVIILLISILFIVSCKPKEETSYNDLLVNSEINKINVKINNENYHYCIEKDINKDEFNILVSNLQKIKYIEKQKNDSNTEINFEYDYIIYLGTEQLLKVKENKFVICLLSSDDNASIIDYSLNEVVEGSFDFLENLNYQPIIYYELVKLIYTELDLETITLTINDIDISLNISNNTYLKTLLLELKLHKNLENQEIGSRNSKYILSFSDYEMTIYDDGTICYIDPEAELDYLFVLNDEFSYFDTLFDSNLLCFDYYNESQVIKVINSMNDTVEINDKNDFLNKLKQIKYIKLSNKEHYELGELKYQIVIDDEIISIYNEFIIVNENLYIIAEGAFSFLNNLKFSSSSGWLPWI